MRTILVADLGGHTIFARIGVMKALNCHVGRVFNSMRKDHHWGRHKLARDRWSERTRAQRTRQPRSLDRRLA